MCTWCPNRGTQTKTIKGVDMQLYCICDKFVEQNKFHTHLKLGENNLGDYPTKHHRAKPDRTVLPLYVSN